MSKYFHFPDEIKKKKNDENQPRILYPKNLLPAVLYACIIKYLDSEEIKQMNSSVLKGSQIGLVPLRLYILENHINKIKTNPVNPDDFIIYNYLVLRDKVKTKDLIVKYYDKHVRGTLDNILPNMTFKIQTTRKKKLHENPLQLKLEFV